MESVPSTSNAGSRAVSPSRPYTVPPFAHACINAAGETWQAAFDHSFVHALADGTLSTERFKFYQMQDARYLEAFADATSIISTRCTAPADKLWFIEAAQMAVVVEQELHAGYGETLGYDADDVASIELTPNNRAYQNHMIATAHTGTLVEAVAAITPCPWLYIELGQKLERDMGEVPADHPYADWLEMYRDPAFNEYMQNLLERLQRFADAADPASRNRAKECFKLSARYEWMFWDQAWTRQEWPV